MGCSPWIPRNSSHRPQYDDTGASRHVESNTVEVLWVSAGFVATDFPSGPRHLPTHAQPACFPRPTKNSEEPHKAQILLPHRNIVPVPSLQAACMLCGRPLGETDRIATDFLDTRKIARGELQQHPREQRDRKK